MSIFQTRCIECHQIFHLGEEVIKLGLTYYHPNCFRKNREALLETLGNTETSYLLQIKNFIDQLTEILNSGNICETDDFWNSWKILLDINNNFNYLYGIAKLHGAVGFIDKFRLDRSLKKYQTSVFSLAEMYREEIVPIKIDLTLQNSFPSTGKPTIEELENAMNESLNYLIHEGKDILLNSIELYKKSRELTRKSLQIQRENIRMQINNIPNNIECFR